MSISNLRRKFHREICEQIMVMHQGRPDIADPNGQSSVAIAVALVDRLSYSITPGMPNKHRSLKLFRQSIQDFLEQAFELFPDIHLEDWVFSQNVSGFEGYEHWTDLLDILAKDEKLLAVLENDYLITPDIVVGKCPLDGTKINHQRVVSLEASPAQCAFVQAASFSRPRLELHASISCKWTIRSDRSQNTRTEALNLVRNRKGQTPHIVAVVAEPLPTRIASIALGTGDLDCVYHFALPELKEAIEEIENEDQLDMLNMLIEGRRLRDISDLPFDLAT